MGLRFVLVGVCEGFVEGHLTRQHMTVVFENEVNAFSNVNGDGHLGPLVEQLQHRRLFARNVDGGRYLLSRHSTPGPVTSYDLR